MKTIPSASLEAEESVLGAIMIDYENLSDVIDRLTPEHFGYEFTRLIFNAVNELHSEKSPCDSLTVGQKLQDSGNIEQITGGMEYLVTIEDSARSLNPRPYLKILEEKRKLRHFQSICTSGLEMSRTIGLELSSAVDYVQSNALALDAQKKTVQSARDVYSSWLDNMENVRMKLQDHEILGYPTGLPDLDYKLNGFQNGKLYVIAGRPAMGKSAFMVNSLIAAGKHGHPINMYSLEMPNEEVFDRCISNYSGVDYGFLQRPNKLMNNDAWDSVTNASAALLNFKVTFNADDNIKLGQIRTGIRRWVKDTGGGPVFIDYLQLIQTPSGANNRVNEVGEISRQLKILAKECGIPIILLSQLSRNLEQRPNKRPINSDLRESGAIEQDADVIIMLYRDEVYNEDSPYKGVMEVIVSKQRGGSIGPVYASAQLNKMRVLPLLPEELSEMKPKETKRKL